ncbi:MAG: putative signal transducing protein [Aquaticitalea sp.]
MDTDRKKVFSGTSHIQAMGFRNALSEAGIQHHELDKSDSAYIGLFDEIQIYVDAKDEMEALAILRKLHY